jgi:hypothetical protein
MHHSATFDSVNREISGRNHTPRAFTISIDLATNPPLPLLPKKHKPSTVSP